MSAIETKKEEFVKSLLKNHNNVSALEQKNLTSKEDYEKILKPVETVLKDYKDCTLDEQRDALYEMSNLEDGAIDAIKIQSLADSAVISFGTKYCNQVLTMSSDKGSYSDDTIFDLASVTKMFTSISIQKLAREGKLDLTKPVTYYVPEFKNLSCVTVYDLLTFKAPIITDGRIDTEDTMENALKVLQTASINKDFDGKRPYTDMGAMILKFVIEKVTNMKYYDYLKENVLIKGMDSTYCKIPEEKLHLVAPTGGNGLYYKDGNIRINGIEKGHAFDPKASVLGQPNGELSGHAGLFSSASDMNDFCLALINNEVLTSCDLISMGDNETGNNKGVQYLGKLCYSKNPEHYSSEVYHPLSGRSFASEGYCGTQVTIDPLNEIYYNLLSNRTHNRMTFIDATKKEEVKQNNGLRTIVLPDGREMVDSSRYAWEKDDLLVRPAIKLAIQNRFLEEFYFENDLMKSSSYIKRER